MMIIFVALSGFIAHRDKIIRANYDHIFEVRLIGGEPFVNKDIYRIIDYFLQSTKISKLVIYTNATIPLKPELMKNYVTPKIVFSITDYGSLSKNTKKVTSLLTEMNIAYRALPPNNWTDSAVIKDQKRSEEGMIDIFEKCCGKNLFTVMYGKIYRCPFVSNAERLHAIPFNEKNGMSLEASADNIIEYLKLNYCDQIYPIMTNCDEHRYYEISFDLLAFIYEFPLVGSNFHQHPNDFIEFLKLAFCAL